MSAPGQPQHLRLRSFSAKNFRLLRDVSLELHPQCTILVGLNDVGKSTLLEAMCLYGMPQRFFGFQNVLNSRELLGDDVPTLSAAWDVDGAVWRHTLKLDLTNPEERLETDTTWWHWQPRARLLSTPSASYETKELRRYSSLASVHEGEWQLKTEVPANVYEPTQVTRYFLTPPPLLLEPSQLARSAPQGQPPEGSGYGWVWYLQTLINRRDDDIHVMEGHIRKLFPAFHSVVVREVKAADSSDAPLKEVILRIHPDQSDKLQEIPAHQASSGLLLALAHFAAAFANRGLALLMMEEPENGLNPKITFQMMERFLEVVRARKQQLVLTTHNAWWLDLVPADSIRVMTRDGSGAHISSPAPERLRALLDKDVFPSEVMSVYGPEGLLNDPVEER